MAPSCYHKKSATNTLMTNKTGKPTGGHVFEAHMRPIAEKYGGGPGWLYQIYILGTFWTSWNPLAFRQIPQTDP